MPEFFPVEEAGRELKQLGVDVAEDEGVIIGQDLLIIARPELVVEVPGGDGFDLVLTGGFQGVFQPDAVIEDVQALGRVIERRLGENRSGQNGPIPDVIDLGHGILLVRKSLCQARFDVNRGRGPGLCLGICFRGTRLRKKSQTSAPRGRSPGISIDRGGESAILRGALNVLHFLYAPRVLAGRMMNL